MIEKNINNKNKEIIKNIIIERIRTMSPNVKITLGSNKGFLNKDELISEVENDTELGKKIIKIQLRYIQALKEGIV